MSLNCQPRGRGLAPLVWFAFLIFSAHPMEAQKSTPEHAVAPERRAPIGTDTASASAVHSQELGDTVALLPWTYRNGKEAALQSAREACNHLLLEIGFNVFLVKPLSGSMPAAMPNNDPGKKGDSPYAHLLEGGRALLGQTITGQANASFVLPTIPEMTAIGEKLQTRYVLAGRAQWSMRNVWVGVSNRAKSMCTVDLLILDMKSRSLVLDAHNIQGDSTENKNMYNTLTSVISLNPLPLVLPGSVTPQEQRAVAVATAKAMDPWLKSQRIQAALDQADLSRDLNSDTASTARFSSLVTPLTNVQATLHVAEVNEKEVATLDSDMAKLFALHTVSLEYKEPNSLRLRARTPKEVLETLQIEEDTRGFAVGEHSKGSSQDISNSPARRLSLLDFCGLLTPGMFDALRARFVRQEKVGDIQAVVYDLTYWSGDDISYQRLWINPSTRLVMKREIYNHSNKLKATYLYQSAAVADSNTRLPGRVEILNASHKRIALFTIEDVKINQANSGDTSTQ